MHRTLRFLQATLSIATLTLCAAAQANDDCSSATPISATGTWPFDTAGATDSPQQSSSCATAHCDVWFRWTATASQSVTLTTCGGTTGDSVIAVYAGSSCPASGTQIACNDDYCGQQSRVFFNAVSGSSYMIQIGNWNPVTTFSGSFSILPGNSNCNSAIGPDVIIGQIIGIQNASIFGGLDSFTLGTTACNEGNALINWIGPTNQHPVIGETAYKFKVVNGSGRFEQVGISWLKHGFAADTANTCCTCQIPSDNQHLGIGCADTYSASQAGAQATLAPRWQIDAYTGYFPYPSANPSWTGTTARRCEILLSDLEPSSTAVRYFAECTYTTADDAQAGNGTNNASYIGLTVTGTSANYTFAISGSTQAKQDAIRAWPTLDPGVSLANVNIPSKGLFIVGAKATDLGGGIYHYEYAVHNVNSYVSCGSFSVPVPPGATLTNIGFHDITYRNGDGLNNVNQTSTDWPAVQAGGTITWSCDTPTVDPNANAIRWATTYNFRFDADRPPVTANAELGLWNVSTPTDYAFTTTVPGGNGAVFSFCSGDGVISPCPCGNNGSAGRGCRNSVSALGAQLSATGTPSLAADTLLFATADELPTALSIVLQGDSAVAPTVFGDGLRCAGGSLKRLFVHSAVGGSISAPTGTDASVSVRSGQLGDTIPSGGTRLYQVYYRDADPLFCPAPAGSTFNISGAISATWAP
jgi:hypothetical protein